jgi:hypothetical protein
MDNVPLIQICHGHVNLFVSPAHLTSMSSLEGVDAWMCCAVDSLCVSFAGYVYRV